MPTKTIELTQAQYDFLIGLRDDLNSSDHEPRFFYQIKTQKEVLSPNEEHESVWVYDDSELRTNEEIMEVLVEAYLDPDVWREDIESDIKALEKDLEGEKKKDAPLMAAKDKASSVMEDWYQMEGALNKLEYEEELVQKVDVHQNCFLTKKAIEKHIEENHYHYHEPEIVLRHAWRSPEFEKLMKIIRGLESSTK